MNKEITPLEALELLKEAHNYFLVNKEFCDKCRKLNNSYAKITKPAYTILEKSLIALQIIKEKDVDVGFFKRMIIEYAGSPFNTCGSDDEALKNYNECQFAEEQLTQEEYELLKEVLL